MSRLDDIEKRLNERMAEIDRKIGLTSGEGNQPPPPLPPPSAAAAAGYGRGGSGLSRGMIAPLNPEFLNWKRGIRRAIRNEFGLIPQPFDFSYLGRLSGRAAVARPVRSFPSRFDLRSECALMPVRNQNPYGTCWAHAALASMESCIMRKTGESPDFSENNLVNLCGYDAYEEKGFNDGGTANMASAYLLRWEGPVDERDDPYGHPGQSKSLAAVRHLQSVRWIPQMRDASDTAGIKEAVTNCGAVWIGYMHDNAAYRKDTAAFYLAGAESSDSGGHAVAIVGWDDDFPASNFAVAPPGNGAWIVRNSWGPEWGDGGYFYASYHDRTFGRWMPGYVFDGSEPVTNYDDVFQYDELGLVTCIGAGETAAANVFTTTRDLTVEAIGCYMLVPGASYKISIHVGCTVEDPSSGTAEGVTTGTHEWAGYDTIRLSSPVRVSAGSRFAVVLEIATPGFDYPIPVEMVLEGARTGKAQASPGQSFVMCGSQWFDMTQLDATMNFCCKAYVKYGSGAAGGEERSHRMFCKACGKYSYVESYGNNRCPHCGAWLD